MSERCKRCFTPEHRLLNGDELQANGLCTSCDKWDYFWSGVTFFGFFGVTLLILSIAMYPNVYLDEPPATQEETR